MNLITVPFPLRPISLLLACAFPLLTQAATVEAALTAEGVRANTNYYGQPAEISTAVIAPTSGSATESAVFVRDGYTDSTSTTSASTDGAGHFGASSTLVHDQYYDPNPLRGSAHVVYTDSIINTSALSQAASFSLAVNALSFTLDAGWMGDTSASLNAQVFVNDSTTALWTLSYSFYASSWGISTASGNGDSMSLLTSSYDASTRTFTYALTSPYTTTLDLGSLDAGQTLSVRYVVDIATLNYAYGGYVAVNFDDPSQIALGNSAALPATASLGFTNPVPEPETYALMAAGLGLVGAAARRRRRRAQ